MANRDATTQLNDFFQSGTALHYRKGEVILYAGDTPQGVNLIASGYVKVYSIRTTGEISLHVIYKPGELFPLLWAYRGEATDVYYEAMDEATILQCPKDNFRSLVYGHPQVTELMIKQLSDVHWIYANRVENLELSRAYDKVVFRLAFLAQRFGEKLPSGQILIQAPITHKDIADSINIIRETASREIEKLEREGLIGQQDHHILIRNPAALQTMLSEL